MTAAAAPMAIGTRGTVGSLIKKEIEYFSKLELELERGASFRQNQGKFVEIACSRSNPRSSFWVMITGWKRKNKRRRSSSGSSGGSGRFLPGICSAVEVADSNGLNGIPGFSYRILKSDVAS